MIPSLRPALATRRTRHSLGHSVALPRVRLGFVLRCEQILALLPVSLMMFLALSSTLHYKRD